MVKGVSQVAECVPSTCEAEFMYYAPAKKKSLEVLAP
jgi:hypothetical protein